MGAWGVGLQANDYAQDAICHFELDLRGVIINPSEDVILNILTTIKTYYKNQPTGLLGAAEYLMNNITNIAHFAKVVRMLEDALSAQIDEDEKWDFKEPENRTRILGLFYQRLHGAPVPMEVIQESNIGLLDKIARRVNDF